MKQLIALLFLISFTTTNAQIDKIELPQLEEEIKIKTAIATYSFYVTKKNAVFLEKKPIRIQDISKELTYIRNKLGIEFRNKMIIFLYVDKNTPYATVDKIKIQLAMASCYKIVYKTMSIEDKDLLKGMYWRNHNSLFRIKQVIQKTKKEEEAQKRLEDSIKALKVEHKSFVPPPPPPVLWYYDFWDRIYSTQKDVVNEIVEDKTTTCITITNEGISINSKIISLDNDELIKVLSNYEVAFLYFSPDLKYKNYFFTILKLKKSLKKILFCEMSSEVVDFYKKEGIEICSK